jgi:long-subunit acyl-CoA synthetase (AMP-forming)
MQQHPTPTPHPHPHHRSESAKRRPLAPCLGHRPIVGGVARPYQYQTFQAIEARVACVASGMKGLGLAARDKVAVLGVNCPDWMVTMQVGSGFRGGI